MRSGDLLAQGIPRSAHPAAHRLLALMAGRGLDDGSMRRVLSKVAEDPSGMRTDLELADLAGALLESAELQTLFQSRDSPAPWRQWGEDIDVAAVQQLEAACELPVTVRCALMPDAHVGYGLPIGGVLATDNAVVPYAVGVDIACRMKMTLLDLPPNGALEPGSTLRAALHRALDTETRFGMGGEFPKDRRRDHPVMEDPAWGYTDLTRGLRDKAWAQLGTSGTGNHFAEFGRLDVGAEEAALLGLPRPGAFLALLTHSGSRGPGAAVAGHYTRLAKDFHPELPRHLIDLAWLDLGSNEGLEYWEAMQLMGRFAAANHERIHHHVAGALGAAVLLDVENHHNFAWRESHGGRDVVVHRKGATPAGTGVLGLIPGTMADPGFLVSGRGSAESMHSASHGAGRRMSRKAAKAAFNSRDMDRLLAERGVELIGGDIDEAPGAYKDVREVVAAQADLVQVLATFTPRLVKMARAGERAED